MDIVVFDLDESDKGEIPVYLPVNSFPQQMFLFW